MRLVAGLACVCALVLPARAEVPRPTVERRLIHLDPRTIPAIVDTRTIFLNRCAGGCRITQGTTDGRLDRSSIGGGLIKAFAEGDTVWKSVVDCMKETFS